MPDLFVPKQESAKPKEEPTQAEEQIVENENHIHSLASFCQNPVGITFDTQEKDEEILLFLRAHFITNISWIIISLLLVTFPLFISFLLTVANIPPLPGNVAFVFLIFYYLLVFVYAYVQFITWFYNVAIVTPKRVVDIDFSDILYHDVAATKLDQVVEVNYTKVGFLHSFFNYGDVFIQTAGNRPNFEALNVPKPEVVTNTILNLMEKK